MTNTNAPNPVLLVLRFRGWELRQYRNGMWDAINAVALTPGFESFADLMEYVLGSGAAVAPPTMLDEGGRP